jgi:hypothetical protein
LKQTDLIYSSESDEFYDYCLYPYKPLTAVLGKLQSINILNHILKLEKFPSEISAVLTTIQKTVGKFHTVWGAKLKDGKLLLELYFYNYNKNPKISMTSLKEALTPFITFNNTPNESINYFMFSIEIDKDIISRKKGADFHIYLSTPGQMAAGYSYLQTKDCYLFENHYEFFEVAKHKTKIVNQLLRSVFITKKDLKKILIPELLSCWRICVAKKRSCDCIYFSRINVDQLSFFLRLFNYPHELQNFIGEHKSKLNHLLYDVGFDYYRHNGELIIEKSGYYEIF